MAARVARPIQIVATPGSGAGRALDTARRLREALSARGRETSLEVFSDLDGLRRWAADGPAFSLLICVGGDGTQSAAARAAMRRSVPLLPVPTGFGNLFARQLRQPGGVRRAIDLVERGEIVRVDVGVRNGEPFLCQEGFGLLSEIQRRVEAGSRPPRPRWRRWLAYYRMAARYFRETTPTPLRVVVDGRLLAPDAVLVVVANVETYGAWLPLTPGASPVDGLFDIFAIRASSKGRILARLLERHLRVPGSARGTLHCRGRRVAIAAGRGRPEDLEVLPRALPV
ncbi:MAG: diacylglycerol/lipid kinase family protein, partial [Candidatus Rokuibacteriota bacterium]